MTAQAAPRVSVVMTLYDKGPFVAEAVRSVLASDFADLELLVVDDGSTDDGPAVVRGFHDHRIRLSVHGHNTGRADAAARGFAAARGEYVLVLDADDTMSTDRIGRQVRFMDAHPEVGACGSAAQIFGRGPHIATWPADDDHARAQLLFDDPVLYGAAIFRRAALERHGIRHEPGWRGPGMDYLFQVAMSPYVRFANLPEPLTQYRIHEGNVRHGRDPVADKPRIQQRVFELLGIEHTEDELHVHMLLHALVQGTPDRGMMHRLHRWRCKLEAMNEERGLFPHELFRQQLARRWERLFHLVCDRSVSGALAHLALSNWPRKHMVYLLKVLLRPPSKKGAGAL